MTTTLNQLVKGIMASTGDIPATPIEKFDYIPRK